jgi:NAD(P)-dependent dehydrogenase (short-subunit alcohol dehydrogenase family)
VDRPGNKVAAMQEAPSFDLSGRRALITGASRGIGRAIAEALAGAGAAVAITGRAPDPLQETAAAMRRGGATVEPLVLDVTDVPQCGAVVAEATHRLGGLDILVNNAGTEEVRPALEVDEALWDKILDTNLKGAFFCAQAAAREMRRTGCPGVIINLCSLTSEVGIPTAAPYGSSKSGLLGMTRALATEWAPIGIRVNAIIPGYFRTGMTEAFFADAQWQQAMLAKIPLGRFGALDDLKGIAVFLASSASAYVTGQAFAVDGGYLAAL